MNDDVSVKKILILTANPNGTDRLRLDKEVRDIKEGLLRSRDRERFVINSEWAVRSRDIRRTILHTQPQIVHFSGHGTEDGGLAFENESGGIQIVQPDALAGLFKLFSECVEYVILNACYSEVQAEAIAQHVDFVIGMSQSIGDQAATEFSVGFYDALGAGYSGEMAYEFGCNAIQMIGIHTHLTPVLFKRKPLETTISTQKLLEEAAAEPWDSIFGGSLILLFIALLFGIAILIDNNTGHTGLFSWILIGLAAGAAARAIYPGRQELGILGTLLLGVIGAKIGEFTARIFGFGGITGLSIGDIAVSTVGSIMTLFIYYSITKRVDENE